MLLGGPGATPPPLPSRTPPATQPPDRSLLSPGTYAVSLPVSDILASLERDTTMNEAQKAEAIDELDIRGHHSLDLEIIVGDGLFTLRRGTDGGSLSTYLSWRFTDHGDDNPGFRLPGGGAIWFKLTPGPSAGSFTLRPLFDGDGPVDAFVMRTLFSMAPFVPGP
jgi:hypothetical protein